MTPKLLIQLVMSVFVDYDTNRVSFMSGEMHYY